jgi:hypothetical protein
MGKINNIIYKYRFSDDESYFLNHVQLEPEFIIKYDCEIRQRNKKLKALDNMMYAGAPHEPETEPGTKVLSQKAYFALQGLLETSGCQVYTVPCQGSETPYYFCYPPELDIVDYARSGLLKHQYSERDNYCFDLSKVKDLHIFRVPEMPWSFVSQTFVDRVNEHQLTGFSFSLYPQKKIRFPAKDRWPLD